MPPKPRNLHIPSSASPATLLAGLKAAPNASGAAGVTATKGLISGTAASASNLSTVSPAAAAAAASSSSSNGAGPSRTWRTPKPHLAHFASSALARNPSSFAYGSQYAASSSAHASSASASTSTSPQAPLSSSSSNTTRQPSSPRAPQLPKRRQPAFNPGGFGMQSAPPPAPGPRSGLAFGQSSAERQQQQQQQSEQDERERERAQSAVLKEVERRTEEIRKEEMAMEGRVQREGEEEAEACYVPPPATLHFHSSQPLPLLYSPDPLPDYTIAYETWGTLNATASNAILLHTGLSASSHVASRGNDVSPSTSSKAGWWEDFVGPGKAIDTDRFYVICTNTLGGCFGSTGPSSALPGGESNVRWATRFPLLSIHDMTRAQLSLLDHLGIDKLYASVGSSMGGMQSLSLAYLAPERVGRVASISACGRAGLGGVGMRYAQRSVLMADPNWNRGFYYDGIPPHSGMKLARQIATITYRSGPEWEQRFGRRMLSEKENDVPRLSPDFLIETYLDHQGERFCLTYDANSMIYLSKAMDLFDMSSPALRALAERYAAADPSNANSPFPFPSDPPSISASRPRPASSESASAHSYPENDTIPKETQMKNERFIPTSKSPHLRELAQGLQRLKDIPALVLGVQSDVLFPVESQRELADALKMAGNERVTYYELGGVWGHDTFLLDVQNVGGAIRGFLH